MLKVKPLNRHLLLRLVQTVCLRIARMPASTPSLGAICDTFQLQRGTLTIDSLCFDIAPKMMCEIWANFTNRCTHLNRKPNPKGLQLHANGACILLCHQKQAMLPHCTKESESISYEGTVHHFHVLHSWHYKGTVGSGWELIHNIPLPPTLLAQGTQQAPQPVLSSGLHCTVLQEEINLVLH